MTVIDETRTAVREAGFPVLLELLRTQLQAIADEAGDTVERTAISPIVVESQDYGSVILDADGGLVAGGGQALLHRIGAQRAVRATIERYGNERIGDGDVYLSNDPHNGGGMHPSDVMVQRPIFSGGVRIGWSVLSAHLIDMGGMSVGSWAPAATECFQEALRLPPVRLVKADEEVSEVWDIFRTNVRFSTVVEMDLRSLLAGTYVAMRKLSALVTSIGVETYTTRLSALVQSTADEMGRRIGLLEPGTYTSTGWTEWGDEFIATPCTLTIADGTLSFDFTGAPDQIPFFINSKPYIITTLFLPLFASLLAPDLPYNEGLIRDVSLECPVGTVVNCVPPAPANCGHMHLGQTAAETMSQCLRMAVWASADSNGRTQIGGYDAQSAHAPNSFWGLGPSGDLEAWMMFDGLMIGQSASPGRDGLDYTVRPIDLPDRPSSQPTPLDVEIYEAWYPILMHERGLIPGAYGAGKYRAGGALGYRIEPWHTDELGAQMLGYRGRIPLPGLAGGQPGRAAEFEITRLDGTVEQLAMNESNVVIRAGETYACSCCSGGGWGDPLDREPGLVAADTANGRIDATTAESVYGVGLSADGTVDEDDTAARREVVRRNRLAVATPAPLPVDVTSVAAAGTGPSQPLAFGVVQRGNVAYAVESGAPLAIAPAHWTDGCPTLITSEADGPVVVTVFLDPQTGAALHTDITPPGLARSFTTMPNRWASAS